ncbi:gamma-glutamyl-gamma-aminobutyrate hydrolase family protein [Granulicella cerasi]|uniref:gamma-glutamyl-gamma-aminobutyrate hydrolase family protein n=1 Tax=Granulicella cerasi TaxID=741063 RepID=UPI0021DFEBA7|nr:gamma-glutamyl-gamma-aminobutyrate hydrolase family protein [Granulicella cerasi]
MNAPRIALPVPTAANFEYNQRCLPLYAEAVRAAGGEPVEISLLADESVWREIAAHCDGVLLPGSPADVDPARFGEEAIDACSPADPAREALDYLLLNDAEKLGKPVLGICFGVQSMNTWRGGKLVQDLVPSPVNHGAGPSVAIAHTALVAVDSLLGSLVDRSEAEEVDGYFRLPVNTSHHQAVAVPGDDLRIVARCPEDAVIEAVEADTSEGRFLLGVQWHPERSTAISGTSRAMFARLVEEARGFQQKKAGV